MTIIEDANTIPAGTLTQDGDLQVEGTGATDIALNGILPDPAKVTVAFSDSPSPSSSNAIYGADACGFDVLSKGVLRINWRVFQPRTIHWHVGELINDDSET